MLDFFPTVIDLMGLPSIAACTGVDQPPTVQCLQGESYAAEFLPSLAASAAANVPKANVFSQWPYPANQSPGKKVFRMGYTVRTSTGCKDDLPPKNYKKTTNTSHTRTMQPSTPATISETPSSPPPFPRTAPHGCSLPSSSA